MKPINFSPFIIGSILASHISTMNKICESSMMKHENYIRTIYSKDKGWFWFGLTVIIQLLFIFVSYLIINISL